MQDPPGTRPPESGATGTSRSLQDNEENLLNDSIHLWRLLPGAILVLLGLTVLTILVVTLDPHRRNLLLGGTAVFLLCAFGFAALIVRSYNRERQRLIEQNQYRDDHRAGSKH